MNNKTALSIGSLLFAWTGTVMAEVDGQAAESLMKKSGCFKRHSVDKKKDAPPYKEIAAKHKGKPDAEQKLYTHLTTNPKVKVDGHEVDRLAGMPQLPPRGRMERRAAVGEVQEPSRQGPGGWQDLHRLPLRDRSQGVGRSRTAGAEHQ